MILDIFNEQNSIELNIKSIQILTLQGAAYLSLLISIYKKALKKNKLIDGYFKLNRSYITQVICLSQQEQLICDSNLIKLSILTKHKDDPDLIKLDLNIYLSLLSSDDLKLIADVKKQMKVMKPKGVKQSQRQIMINDLKDSIVCSNYELLTALRDWVDSCFARPNGFLSKAVIKAFQDTLNQFTQGDLDLALEIVKIATIQGYRDCTWAINYYNKDKKMQKQFNQPSSAIKVTEQTTADKKKLSDTIF